MTGVEVRAARPTDLAEIESLYAPYALETTATFYTEPPDGAHWESMLARCEQRRHPFLVARDGDRLAGIAYASTFRPRPAYDGTVETTVYVARGATGRGIGRAVYGALLDRACEAGFHLAVAGVTIPNPASERLHRALGFEPVGVFAEVGFKLGGWRDVQWWQCRLPGRSDGC